MSSTISGSSRGIAALGHVADLPHAHARGKLRVSQGEGLDWDERTEGEEVLGCDAGAPQLIRRICNNVREFLYRPMYGNAAAMPSPPPPPPQVTSACSKDARFMAKGKLSSFPRWQDRAKSALGLSLILTTLYVCVYTFRAAVSRARAQLLVEVILHDGERRRMALKGGTRESRLQRGMQIASPFFLVSFADKNPAKIVRTPDPSTADYTENRKKSDKKN